MFACTDVSQLLFRCLNMLRFTVIILTVILVDVSVSQSSTEDYPDSSDSPAPTYTATDCLSYIYVAWIIFIYSVGLGVQTDQFSQVVVISVSSRHLEIYQTIVIDVLGDMMTVRNNVCDIMI